MCQIGHLCQKTHSYVLSLAQVVKYSNKKDTETGKEEGPKRSNMESYMGAKKVPIAEKRT